MRTFSVVLVLTVLFSMVALGQQVQSGRYMFDKNLKDYTLDKESGDRVVQLEVTFPKAFEQKPEVIVAVNYLDCDKEKNLRYEVKTISVSRDGFLVQVKTWGDTKIYAIGGGWIAVSAK
ncbi:MAG: H-type lectin domain-containing protein [bacterium]